MLGRGPRVLCLHREESFLLCQRFLKRGAAVHQVALFLSHGKAPRYTAGGVILILVGEGDRNSYVTELHMESMLFFHGAMSSFPEARV